MKYFVSQYGNEFFYITRQRGYVKPTLPYLLLCGTEITHNEYQKLFYSSAKRTISTTNDRITGAYDRIRMDGNAEEILGREVMAFGRKVMTT